MSWQDIDLQYTDAAVILRDQTEGHLLCLENYTAAWANFPGLEMTDSRGPLGGKDQLIMA